MDRLFMRVVQLGQAAQKHCRDGDVLIGPSELWGIVPPIHGVVLDLTGAPLGTAHRSMHAGHSVGHQASRRSWWLMQPLSS